MGMLLKDKVAIVTGSGRGIGRDIALALAAQGARVVVNDIGGSERGDNPDVSVAASVVKEIAARGGAAIANTQSIAAYADAERMVSQAVEAFGRLDIVVNNAGILRDSIFHKMSEADWDAVLGVHLKGSFNLSRAAAGVFRERESGSFIHMTSTAGLIGAVGQANYASAKMGVVGMSRSIAMDMGRFGVRSNCIAPFAWSRLVGTVPVGDAANAEKLEQMKRLTPDKIAPLVVALASDAAKDVSGQIFAVRGDEIFLMSQPRPVRSAHCSDGWTPERVLSRVLPAMRPGFTPLERGRDVFCWDPL
jgi:NAD(P)-dependent dehydrogenase (short-subunit alcohol dehydrogenase family)